MPERVFLGWNQPFLVPAVAWLLERKADLHNLLIVVPTAQSGRRLRETLAEQSGALLSPQVVTPGSLLQLTDPKIAPDWLEKLAWCEVLEAINDWSPYEGLFPNPPDTDGNWSGSLGTEFWRLRRSLQENGMTLITASWCLRETTENDRWSALAALESRVDSLISSWGMKSRSRALAENFKLPDVSHIVLAGVPDLPPILQRTLSDFPGTVTILTGAPETEAEHFSPLGLPAEIWTTRPIRWPENGSVNIAADPRQQAIEALRAAGLGKRPSDEIALGSADVEIGAELERTFSQAGWTAFHPSATPIVSGLARWFSVWRSWLAEPTLAAMSDLLALPETSLLIGGKRAQKAKRLAELRDDWMVLRAVDLSRRIDAENFRSEFARESAIEVLEAARSLEQWRNSLLATGFIETLVRLLEILSRTGPTAAGAAEEMLAWLEMAKPFIKRVKRSAAFWIELMTADFPAPPPEIPAGRVIDVQGWLELFHEPGEHLILCGLNEGKIPARGGGEPWLSESIRTRLGLVTDADRAARDAYLFNALLESRKQGRVDLICGKSGGDGTTLLPSRLLLLAEKAELPARVTHLFREIEPPEAGLRWHADWQWTPVPAPPPKRISVTSLSDYLRCPFRYYLKHVNQMQGSGTGRVEWDNRDFGVVSHEIMEEWGRDENARDLSKSEALEAWFSDALDRIVDRWFGNNVPLAIRIQTEAMRQRLAWLARIQAAERAAGWKIISVEDKMNLPIGDVMLVAKIDRIEQNQNDGRIRVLDYKTGKAQEVEKAHRIKVTAATKIPLHLGEDSPAVFFSMEKNKPAKFLWTNLQLPLYAAALAGTYDSPPSPGYFSLGSTSPDVAIREWNEFSEHDLEAALDCTKWIIEKISAQVFWPPAEKVMYDDYQGLTAGRLLEETFHPLLPFQG